MAGLSDRRKKEVTPTTNTVLGITGKKATKEKYPVNVVFNGDEEPMIRKAAELTGCGVATFIKIAVKEKMAKMELPEE